ncbi:FMN-binding protein [Burkholderia sp. SR8]|uniref:FMN-binding protein n=1 Tax=Burkholderia sp. SR8 TaxID=3062277 RepID=UPI0040640D38
MNHDQARWIPLAALATTVGVMPTVVFGADYLSVAQAQKVMFPDATTFVARPVILTDEQRKALSEQAGTRVNPAQWNVFAAKSGDTLLGYVITDAVIGKFQLINYAVAFGTDGTIRDMEILSYREEHGGEVRTRAWRKQFEGKTGAAPLQLGEDIQGISGATMSCTHVTEGVRRLAVFVQAMLARK